MAEIYIREGRREVLVVLDKHMTDRLTTMEEAAKVLQREIIREGTNPNRNAHWDSPDHLV